MFRVMAVVMLTASVFALPVVASSVVGLAQRVIQGGAYWENCTAKCCTLVASTYIAIEWQAFIMRLEGEWG